MSGTPAARRYAKALFLQAAEEGVLDPVYKEFQALGQLLHASSALRDFVGHPLMPMEHRQKTLRELLAADVEPLTLRFLEFLDRQSRMALLVDICETLQELVREEKGIVHARITFAAAFRFQDVEAIRAKIALKTGKEVESESRVDFKLIGGFRVQVGDRVHDASIRTQLDKFKREIINAE